MDKKDLTRREFVGGLAVAGAAVMLAGSGTALAAPKKKKASGRVRGYAAFDTSGTLKPWEFERRPMGDDDILIDIKFASICHSDIHQMKGDWGPQAYPQVPGHEIVGLVAAVGKNVTKFKVGDRAGVGCMVDSCMSCDNCDHGDEHLCQKGQTLFTYGYPDKREPTGITQGGYSNQIVVRDHFAVHIPEHISMQEAAPLLCAGITTYSPLMQANFDIGAKVGVIGIGGLGHMAVKLAVAKGAEVYAFTTSPSKVDDIKRFGATPVVVDGLDKLAPYRGTLDWAISTVPVKYDVAAYASVVKPHGTFTQVGMPDAFALNMSVIGLSISRVKFQASLIGGMPETQEVVHFCADNGVRPQIELIKAEQINEAWTKVVSKQARYRYVIDAATF
ncbi:MAG: NAD(P)-dependent alcohol dehydrogenase [Deltaproteobacteria bacterium]|nr:MAG: NAD(P)-dependent alcohol dehydrogenase [Deltaproteobacteria bacterium]